MVTVHVPGVHSDSVGSPGASVMPSWLKITGVGAPEGSSGSRSPEGRDTVTTGHLLGARLCAPGFPQVASLNPLGSGDIVILVPGGGL